jgi:hypothetical protein
MQSRQRSRLWPGNGLASTGRRWLGANTGRCRGCVGHGLTADTVAEAVRRTGATQVDVQRCRRVGWRHDAGLIAAFPGQLHKPRRFTALTTKRQDHK